MGSFQRALQGLVEKWWDRTAREEIIEALEQVLADLKSNPNTPE